MGDKRYDDRVCALAVRFTVHNSEEVMIPGESGAACSPPASQVAP